MSPLGHYLLLIVVTCMSHVPKWRGWSWNCSALRRRRSSALARPFWARGGGFLTIAASRELVFFGRFHEFHPSKLGGFHGLGWQNPMPRVPERLFGIDFGAYFAILASKPLHGQYSPRRRERRKGGLRRRIQGLLVFWCNCRSGSFTSQVRVKNC